MPKGYAYQPMDVSNMFANGVTRLALSCHGRDCWHSGVLDVSAYPGDLLVQSFKGRVVCSRCGSRDVDVRPDWTEIG
jgi:hypothetical protein